MFGNDSVNTGCTVLQLERMGELCHRARLPGVLVCWCVGVESAWTHDAC